MSFSRVVQGGTPQAADVNQLIQTLNGTLITGNPGPVIQFSTQVINTTVASVLFSAIPSTFKNLFLTWQCRSDTAAVNTFLEARINSDGSANYYQQLLNANNTTIATTNGTGDPGMNLGDITGANATSPIMCGSGFAAFPNWNQISNTLTCTSQSSVVWGTAAGTAAVEMHSNAYNVTGTARTSLLLFPGAGNFAGTVAGGSIFTLYGSL